ncbi:hypothetical protein EYY60_16860 [Flavobacterium zhairuonense]|uniref:hypothetical protein n=1 Tax=Flavobacterium zhairuonense TaxID=2493631 RepID=UPI0010484812|nr:hypothetical protein [Flavobacterium zhairuonense]KAF2507626.1 hypothetical protein EYY60_16860 [Flavobacterium zhairuonense]
MKKRKEFVFNNVITFHLAWMIPISIPCMLFYGFLYEYLFKGSFTLSLVIVFITLYFVSIWAVLKMLSFKVIIWFDDYHLYVKRGERKFEKFLKQDIIGFYSYDYETTTPQLLSSKISIQFYLKNNKRIYLYDVEYRNKYETEKGKQLRKFLITAREELGFSKLKLKRFQNVYWYTIN